jgi:hypothetical protein
MNVWDFTSSSDCLKRGGKGGGQLEQLPSRHVLYTKGGEESIGGVGILVNKNIKDRVVKYEGESSRVASLTLKMNNRF